MSLTSVNPATGAILRRFDELSDAELDERLARAAAAFAAHRRTTFAARAAAMTRAAELLERDRDALARTMVEEMGKTRRSAVAEVEKCAWVCRHYAAQAAGYLADEPLPSEGQKAWLRYLPIGPVLAIMPWNFPFWQVFRFAAPALMAGNVGLLKHAANVPACAEAIEALFAEAGFAPGVFQNLRISSSRVAAVIADERVRAVTLTGSEHAGSEVAAAAGRHLKKTVLELGGSDPFVIMPSADLEAAVATAVTARHINNGQSCIAAKRFIVDARVYEAFERRFVAAVAALRVGDPMGDDVDVGPIATAALREQLAEQVERSVAAGARLVFGGRRLEGPGSFYQPTVLADIPRGAPAHQEEVFGPVSLLFRARDLDDAIAIANDSPFGLGSSVWTHDPVERQRFVDELEAGQTFVNGMVVSDPRLPFGGVKRSGYGRELGALGIREFVNIKTVVEKLGAASTAERAATE
jgi:succinate-semialdehyde dehydrogenase/glutarate-semialdehyde dehydrogenase